MGDVTPRGENPGFVQIIDNQTIAIPDRPGNNCLDTLTNVLEHPGVGVIFFIPGVNETLRINGHAEIRTDSDLSNRFEIQGKLPLSVLLIQIHEVYLHCAKALMRSDLWSSKAQAKERPIPAMAQMIKDQSGGNFPLGSDEEMKSRYAKLLY